VAKNWGLTRRREERRSRNESWRNPVVAKFVCHNLSCLIHAMEEFGIDPNFGRVAV
jgi:hypothetical protein